MHSLNIFIYLNYVVDCVHGISIKHIIVLFLPVSVYLSCTCRFIICVLVTVTVALWIMESHVASSVHIS